MKTFGFWSKRVSQARVKDWGDEWVLQRTKRANELR